MATSDFDIQSVLEFKLPSYLCKNCYAIGGDPCSILEPLVNTEDRAKCKICNFVYQAKEGVPQPIVMRHILSNLEEGYSGIKFDDPLTHCRNLALIAQRQYTPINRLFVALSEAQSFVHFVTYGISDFFIGALKMVAQKNVAVKGIISNVKPPYATQLKEFERGGHLKFVIFQQTGDFHKDSNVPHQKMLIVDGLIAFTGAANLTVNGWRKAEKSLDKVDVVTSTKEICQLNNQYFSPLWGEYAEKF